MTDLDLLASLPYTGDNEPVLNDWARAEKSLHTTFPPPFKKFLNTFGGAKFDDFLRVYRAGADNENADLIARTLAARHTLTETRPHLHRLLEDRGTSTAEVIRWGGTDNADMLLLIPHPDPDRWAVLTVIGRGPEYDLYEGPPESYLLGVLRGRLMSQVFPDDFPDEEPTVQYSPWI
ncbi:hypothetical protein ACJ6WD_37965 [Streptomyces sp. VTCC 41912]|uniref:hypothetical protein n=1 Tax=Streptomyces sp. VTCC 41912 TaxID=3383243 RepID=UPI003896D282